MNAYPIDFVVTWVDDSDPVWRAKKQKYTGKAETEGNTQVRYRDWETLRYWFRGVEQFAPWVRYVYFVTDDQKPEWLNIEHPKLKWVKHTDFIPKEYLPTFSSHTIEWNLHRIEGLSENFVYFNDDVFLIRQTQPEDFFIEGVPCDLPKISYLYPDGFFSHIAFNNTCLLNRYYSLNGSIRSNWIKWVKNQPLKQLLKILFFGRKKLIPGIESYHICISYRKNTFLTLWNNEYELIHATCMNKQRTQNDISHWCVRNWQIFSGDFHPRKPTGKFFSTADLKKNQEALDYLRKQKGKVICLNDSEDETDFQLHKEMILQAFAELLPDRSSFEIT